MFLAETFLVFRRSTKNTCCFLLVDSWKTPRKYGHNDPSPLYHIRSFLQLPITKPCFLTNQNMIWVIKTQIRQGILLTTTIAISEFTNIFFKSLSPSPLQITQTTLKPIHFHRSSNYLSSFTFILFTLFLLQI